MNAPTPASTSGSPIARRTRGTPSTTVSRCRSWTRGADGRGTGSIYTFAKAAAKPSKPGEWNTLEITLKGNRVITTINGVQVTEFDSSEL